MRGGGGRRSVRRRRNGVVGQDGEKGFCCHYPTHAVTHQDGTDRRVNGRGGSGGGDFEVDYYILKPNA